VKGLNCKKYESRYALVLRGCWGGRFHPIAGIPVENVSEKFWRCNVLIDWRMSSARKAAGQQSAGAREPHRLCLVSQLPGFSPRIEIADCSGS
jgi:hypothetical protein